MGIWYYMNITNKLNKFRRKVTAAKQFWMLVAVIISLKVNAEDKAYINLVKFTFII
jgi:hypothetical protein